MKSMINAANVVVDLETLDVCPRAIILAVGAVAVVNGSTHHFYQNISQSDQPGRTSSVSTLEFWALEENTEARTHLVPNQVTLTEGFNLFNDWVSKLGAPKKDIVVWGNSSDFDIAMWRDVNQQMGAKDPFEFWNTACLRTLSKTDRMVSKARGIPTAVRPEPVIKHHALYDAWAECTWLYNMLNNLASK